MHSVAKFFASQHFERKDISKYKKETLKQLEDELKKYKKQSDKDFQ